MEPALCINKHNQFGFVMGAMIAKTLEPLLKKMVYGILSISILCNNSKKEIETWIGDFAVELQAMQIRKSRKREGRKNGKTKSEKARAIEIEQKYKICNLLSRKNYC